MLKTIAIAAAVIAALLVTALVWLVSSVARGGRKRDRRLLACIAPISRSLDAGQTAAPQEILSIAARPELRHMLFEMLRQMNRLDLFPTGYSSTTAQGESALVYWMMHPNELQEAPEAIELIETVRRPMGGEDADFCVYRYRMPAGHWAANDGWRLGVAGPIRPGAAPYSERPEAFSRRGDIEGKVRPSELVDWYAGMLGQKRVVN